jgi:hypothetical protein
MKWEYWCPLYIQKFGKTLNLEYNQYYHWNLLHLNKLKEIKIDEISDEWVFQICKITNLFSDYIIKG